MISKINLASFFAYYTSDSSHKRVQRQSGFHETFFLCIFISTFHHYKRVDTELEQVSRKAIKIRSSWSRGSFPSSHARGQRFEPRRQQYFKLLLDPGDFHSNPSGLLYFNKSETVLWTITKILLLLLYIVLGIYKFGSQQPLFSCRLDCCCVYFVIPPGKRNP